MTRSRNVDAMSVKPCQRAIGLTVRGQLEPEVYTVSEDVFRIVRKALALNQAIGPYRGIPLIDFDEVRFLLRILGVSAATETASADLWIGED